MPAALDVRTRPGRNVPPGPVALDPAGCLRRRKLLVPWRVKRLLLVLLLLAGSLAAAYGYLRDPAGAATTGS